MSNQIRSLAGDVIFALDWTESRMDSVQCLIDRGLVPAMGTMPVDRWQDEVEDFCLKTLGLDKEDNFLIGFWGYDHLCDGLYRWSDAVEDMRRMRKYMPREAEMFAPEDLTERRRKIESVFYNSLPY